jgi:hypothetical protein
MTQVPTLSMFGGRARSSFEQICGADRWLGGHAMHVIGAMAYSPTTTAKRNVPGNSDGVLT